ncbi:MAG: RDD family protein [Chloroflexota bacterium]
MYNNYQQDDNLLIDTPENLVLEAEVAGYGSRFLAAFIDYAIIIITLCLLAVLFFRGYFYQPSESRETWTLAAFGLIVFLVIMFYHLFFEFFWNGQTPGKRRVGLRVVMNNGRPVTTSAALTRNLVRLFDFLPVFYGAGLLSMFISRYVQRLGDIAGGTIVVKERAGLSLQSLRDDVNVDYIHLSRMSPLDERIQLDNLTTEDRRVLVGYLQRRESMPEEQRDRLSLGMARKLAFNMGLADTPRATIEMFPGLRSAETFLEQVARTFEVTERADAQRRSNAGESSPY